MVVKKTLYQVLQVARTASPEVISAAYQARLQELGASAAPEVQSERTLLREAHDVLCDPVRKKLYDDKLREEALRALSSGGEEVRARPASALAAEEPRRSPLGGVLGIVLIAAILVSGWAYMDHTRKAEALRIERERLAAEQKLREAEVEKKLETVDWAKDQYEREREARELRQWQAQRERENQRWRYEQERVAQQQRMEEQRALNDQRRADYERQRQEQENLRRSQMQLERERRHLQELERNRGMKF